jgi:hypothetical protein
LTTRNAVVEQFPIDLLVGLSMVEEKNLTDWETQTGGRAMEDIWKRAKSFAEEAAKRSQTLTNSVTISDLVTETTKKSKELAAEASKKADQIKTAALKQADQIQIKSLSLSLPDIIIPSQLSSLSLANSSASASASASYSPSELRKFGVTDDLREFVKGLTSTTFQNFPVHGNM